MENVWAAIISAVGGIAVAFIQTRRGDSTTASGQQLPLTKRDVVRIVITTLVVLALLFVASMFILKALFARPSVRPGGLGETVVPRTRRSPQTKPDVPKTAVPSTKDRATEKAKSK